MNHTALLSVVSLLLVPSAVGAQARRLAAAHAPAAAVAAAPIPVTSGPGRRDVRLAWIHGSVDVAQLTPSYSFEGTHAAAIGEPLRRGTRIRVGENSTAELTFANGTTVRLGERTNLVLFASPNPPADGRPPSFTTTLVRGSMRVSSTAARGALVPVATASAVMYLGRSNGAIQADAGGRITRIAVYSGRMHVGSGTREYNLRAGHGVVETFQQAAMTERVLTPAPRWTGAPADRVISSGAPMDVSMSFAPSGATPSAHWTVELARDTTFRDLVSVERLDGTATQWTARALLPGTYYTRIIGTDADRFQTGESNVARFSVVSPQVIPGHAAEGAESGRLARVEVPEGFYCGLDGGRMATTGSSIRLVPGRSHQVRCSSSPEGTDVRELTIDADRAGPLFHDVQMRGVTWGEGVLSVRLTDAEGNEVPYADVRVTADQGVTAEALREADARGSYTAAVHWPRGVTRARFRFSVNGSTPFEQELSQDDLPSGREQGLAFLPGSL